MKSIFSHISGILNISLNRRVDLLKKKYRNEISDLSLFDNEKIADLENAIGMKIKNPGLYEQAMIHRSYLQMIDDDRQEITNERLEFLGDSILGMAVAEYLFFSNLQELEGNLTKTRAQIVNKKSLAYCSKNLNLENFILLSFSARRSLETGSESILADAMEALIAAVYLDNDFKTAKYFIYDNIISVVVDSDVYDDKNYKSILLEDVQANGYSYPKYFVDSETGPDHDKTFIVSVFVDNRKISVGSGKNKKEAEQQAAKNALNSKDLYH